MMIINKNKCVQITLHGVHVSSIINEGIRALLNLLIFFFFHKKILQAQKEQKRIQANKNKKGSVFMHLKNI